MPEHLFYDDYSEGFHPEIMQALVDHNEGQMLGYGKDELSALAQERIRVEFQGDVDVHFVAGGTLANRVCLASMLRSYEGVISPDGGHIFINEAGAIENTGHKIIPAPTSYGKLTPELIDAAMPRFGEHSVKAGAIYLTQSTEVGTAYTLDELQALTKHAKKLGLYTYIDGARMAMGLAATGMSLADSAKAGVDMLYLGGTKNGGNTDAIVIINDDLKPHFRSVLKQQGALAAKGRIFGGQFARFFDADRLWHRLGEDANQRAASLAAGLGSIGIRFAYPPQTNQIFPILPNSSLEPISEHFGFHPWKRGEDNTVVRLVCSYATPEQAVNRFVELAETAIGGS